MFCNATGTDTTAAIVLSRIAKFKEQCFLNNRTGYCRDSIGMLKAPYPDRHCITVCVHTHYTNSTLGLVSRLYQHYVRCVYEMWPVAFREEHRQRGLEELGTEVNIWGSKRRSKSWRLRWAVYVAHMAVTPNVRKVMVMMRKRKRQLGRPRRKYADNIKVDI